MLLCGLKEEVALDVELVLQLARAGANRLMGVTVHTRLRQWNSQCHSNYTFHPATSTVQTVEIPHASRVEQLIHTELKEYRKKIGCCNGCGRGHDEWFDVQGEHVVRVFRKWRNWIEQDPYAFDPDSGSWMIRPEMFYTLAAVCQPVPEI